MQPETLREGAKSWVANLDALEISHALIREIFATFFLLRWVDQQDAEQEAVAVFEDRGYTPVLPPNLHWRTWNDYSHSELGQTFLELARHFEVHRYERQDLLSSYLLALVEPLRKIAEINPVYLVNVVQWLAQQPFETAADRRQLLEFYDIVIAETTSGHEGEHLTPPSVAQLVVALADPRPGERLYDPCFGAAGFLTTAWLHAESIGAGAQSRRGTAPLEIFGVDINRQAFLLGLTRLVLAGVDSPHLQLGDSLERDPVGSPSREGFDVILANPPMGMRTSREPMRYEHFPIMTGDATGLFVQHILSQLKPQGRALVSVAEGFLFQGGRTAELRRHLVERGQVEAVIGVPSGVYLPYTAVKGSLLLLRKAGAAQGVRMVDASSFFEVPKGRRAATIREPLIAQLAEIVHGQSSQHAWEVSREELAAADWDLSTRRREKGSLGQLLQVVDEALSKTGEVTKLSDCAKVFAGRSIKARDLVEQPDSDSSINYVRIRDIQRGVVTKGGSWVRGDALTFADSKWQLLAGDVLLSKSGTIGKAGIVRNGAVRGIAANGLYVVRVDQDRLDPNFLIAYLASAACQNWLKAQSRGVVIQHLNRAVLDQLPVPLPPLSMQRRAASQYREYGTDVLVFLAEATGAKELFRFAAWMSDISRRIPAFLDGLDAAPSLTHLEPLLTGLESARRWTQDDQIASQHLRWVTPLLDGLAMLHGVSQIPEGPSLLNVVQDAERCFRLASSSAAGHLPVEAQGRALAEQLAGWMKGISSDLLARAEITAKPEVSKFQAGATVEFSVIAENASALPLRDVRLGTVPDWGTGAVRFLPEKESFRLALHGDAPKVAGTFTLQLQWSAKTLGGQTVGGEVQLSFEVVESVASAKELTELGGSPYVTGSPLEPNQANDVFFGREQLLGQISRQIVASGNVVLLEGNRRAGKTSILRHLEGVSSVPGWLAVYCSLQGAEGSETKVGVPTAEVFREIATCIAKALVKLKIDVPLPNGKIVVLGQPALGIARACSEGISEHSPFADLRDYLEVALALLASKNLGLLLMLDEFDKLQEGIDNGVTSPQVPENIRFLIQTYPRFSAILTGSRRLRRLREEHWSALYGLGTSIQVTALDRDDARRIVTEPVKGKLTYSPESIERVIEMAACQPYILQCLCNRIFDFAAQTKTRSITISIVDQACAVLVKDNEHFASLWDYAKTDRRRMILMLCAKRGSPDLIAFGELQQLLAQEGVEVGDEALARDLAHLRELELIDLVGNIGDGHYQLTIPLMGAWIEQQQDFAVVLSRARTETEEESA